MRYIKLFSPALLLGLTLSLSPLLFSATVTWDAPTYTTSDTDVLTTTGGGRLVEAFAFASNSTKVVNGVTFTNASIVSGSTIGVGEGAIFTAANGAGWTNYADFATAATGGFTLLSSAYQGLLSSATYQAYTGTTATWTLTNLVIGQAYEFQLWSGSPDFATARQNSISSGGNTVTLDFNQTDAVGGVGQFTIGRFTADSSTQDFILDARGLGEVIQINAAQLIAVPEPSSYLMLMAVLFFGFQILRRRINTAPRC